MIVLDRSHRPLVIDVRELGRRAGSMITRDLVAPAPEGLGTMGLSVPPGSDVELALRLESVIEGVLVSGTASARIEGECSRCLAPVTDEVSVPISELYSYPQTDARGRPVVRDAEPDLLDPEPEVVDDTVDLEQPLRDAIVLALPIAPLCRPDCPGLCPQCGVRLGDDPEHRHDVIDERWAALAGLLENDPTHDPEKED